MVISELFKPLTNSLRRQDPFLLCADYQSYIDCQAEVDHAYRDQHHWSRMSILNVARIGKFSSDRSIRDYCKQIWKVDLAEKKPPAEREIEAEIQHRLDELKKTHGVISGEIH